MVAQFAITFGAWLVLLFATTNLVGFLLRGLFTHPELNGLEVEGHDFIKGVINQRRKAELTANVIAFFSIIAFLLALYHFWNAGVILAAMMLMAARVPDLIEEIKHGRKLRTREMNGVPLYVLSIALSWASLPVLWYALYRM